MSFAYQGFGLGEVRSSSSRRRGFARRQYALGSLHADALA